MRAWVLQRQANIAEKPLELLEVPQPPLEDNEIRIKVLVCGICRTDLHIAEGDLPHKKLPLILGHEIVGIVSERGKEGKKHRVGDRVGVSWLHSTCGKCKFCISGRENYCPDFSATGWDADGGFAEYTTIGEDFAHSLNDVHMKPEDIAPLMCPGIAGYLAFKLTESERGDKIGLYGFGPTAYYVLKVAKALGIDVFVSTRSPQHIEEAKKNGALWAADASKNGIPYTLDAAIVFPPAGALIEPSLSGIQIGGTLVLAPVSMSAIEINNYSKNLWGRNVKTLYNVKIHEAREFLDLVKNMDLKMKSRLFPFEELQDAMMLVKNGEIKEPNAVIKVADE
jgi:propanol-preferring alcohol dehydrogenase